ILRDEWLRAVAAVASERRTPLSAEDQQAILERLVDDTLLIRHGLDLGLVQGDPRLRGHLVDAVMHVTLEAQPVPPPTDAELQAYFDARRATFAGPPRLRLTVSRRSAAGERQPWLPAVPDALLPPAQLQRYLGPTLTRLALTVPVGETVETG